MSDFKNKLYELQILINAEILDDSDKLSVGSICSIANIPAPEKMPLLMQYIDIIPDAWFNNLSDAFGVSKEWLAGERDEMPFFSERMSKVSSSNAMDILRNEHLSDVREFIVAFGTMRGILFAMIIRHTDDYCYEVYRHMYPFFSVDKIGVRFEVVEFYRFIKYALKIGKLRKQLYFCDEERFFQYYKGEIYPLGIKNEKSDADALDGIVNLTDDLVINDIDEIIYNQIINAVSLIRSELVTYESLYAQADWNAIISNNPELAKDDKERFEIYVKGVERTDERLTGIEAENIEDEPEDNDEPYDVNSIFINPKSISAYQVEHWINSHMLDLSPEYQRNLVWDTTRKSLLIESMMLNIPIPAFYLDEKEDGVKTVIDGMQRLSTIHSYFSGEFKLRGLQYLKMYNGCSFDELSAKYRSRLEETQLSMNILDARCPEDAKFDVFCRVNTGGMPLNAQEVRNALSSVSTRKLLKDMSKDSAFQKATLSRISDVRMGAQELCLRCLCIIDHFNWDEMKLVDFRGLKKTMDRMIVRLNSETENDMDIRLTSFHRTMEQCSMILGSKSFSRKDDPFKINKSITTAWAVCLTKMQIENAVIEQKAAILKDKYSQMLIEDIQFQDSISKSTASRKSIEYTICVIRNLIEESINDSQD